MSCVVAERMAVYSPTTEDRSLSVAGSTLRRSLEAAKAPPIDDRGDELYLRVAAALEKAHQQENLLIRPDTFGRALDSLYRLPREIPLPDVVVESENEIGLDWDEGRDRVLSLTIRDTPAVGFAALF